MSRLRPKLSAAARRRRLHRPRCCWERARKRTQKLWYCPITAVLTDRHWTCHPLPRLNLAFPHCAVPPRLQVTPATELSLRPSSLAGLPTRRVRIQAEPPRHISVQESVMFVQGDGAVTASNKRAASPSADSGPPTAEDEAVLAFRRYVVLVTGCLWLPCWQLMA